MKIEFRDLTGYLSHPPALDGLIGKVEDCRGKRKGDVLIIIPSYHDNYRLRALLRELGKQSFKKFDVAVIYAQDDPFARNGSLPIIHSRRKGDFGFAGAAYAGQLLALRHGYKYFLATDVDKFPARPDSLSLLYHAAEKGGFDYVRGKFIFEGLHLPPDRLIRLRSPVFPSWLFPFAWGLVRTEKLRKAGLYALPLYMGCDDLEFNYRLNQTGAKSCGIGEILFRTYYPGMRLLKVTKSGGQDGTYQYSRLVALRRMPEIFLLQFQSRNPLGMLKNAALVVLPYIFMIYFYQRMAEERMPVLLQYRAKSAEGKLASAKIVLDEPAVKTAPVQRKGGEPGIFAGASAGGLLLFLKLIANSPSELVYTDFFSVIPDSFVAPCGKRGSAQQVIWKRKVRPLKKAVFAMLAACETAGAVVRGLWNMAWGKHLFSEYGKESIE